MATNPPRTRTPSRGRSRLGRVAVALATAVSGALATLVPAVVGPAVLPSAQAATNTVVSLTFDDSQSSQMNALPAMAQYGMKGTFYVESGDVPDSGTGYYMNWSQVGQVASAGHEIGGHTLHHTDLTSVNEATARAAVCDDRTNLVNHGYNPVSFAYPYAAVNATAQRVVQECGYTSGRGVGGGKESIPPQNAFALRTPEPADSSTGLAGLQQGVINTENSGGGWAIMTFHGVCNNSCTGGSSITVADFNAFVAWLAARASNGTVVRTVGEVMGGATPPAGSAPSTSITCNDAVCNSTAYSGPVTVGLQATDPDNDPTTTYYTTDGSNPQTSSTRKTYSAPFAVSQTSTVRYYSQDNGGLSETPKSQTITIQSATPNDPPTTSISCNNAACTTAAYTGPVTVRLSATDPNGDSTTTWYTTDGTDPVNSNTRQQYTGPFTFSQSGAVRYYSIDSKDLAETPKSQTIAVTTPPAQTVVSLTFDDSQSSQLNALPAMAQYGMKGTFYVESGDVPNSGTGYYMNWSQVGQVASAGHEIGGHTLHHTNLTSVSEAEARTAVCDDRANLVNHGYNPISFAYPEAAVNATAQRIVQECGYTSGRGVGSGTESIPPQNAFWLRTPEPADSSTGLAGLQQGVLDAENSGGGWAVIVFHGICNNSCTGGSSTTVANFNAFVAWLAARAGNGTVVRTVGDVIGGGTPLPGSAPSTAITCNNAVCNSTAYTGPVTVGLTATDPDNNTTTTYYTTDGSDPQTSSTRQTYSAPFTVSQTSTVRYYSQDTTGLSETPKSQTITIGAATSNDPPTTSITCNDAACASTAYSSAVTVRLSATDPNGDSTTTWYTTDGSDPVTSSTRQQYSAAFTVNQTGAVRYYSVDSKGLAETPKSQSIAITAAGTAPTTTITCNNAACSSGWYRNAQVNVRLAATDPDGGTITRYYTLDGSDPRTSPTRRTYTTAFPVTQTTTVRYASVDSTGLAEEPKQQEIRIDRVGPTASITSPTAGSSIQRGTVVTIEATVVDQGTGAGAPSGVDRVVFRDGSRQLGTVTTPVSGSTYQFSWNTAGQALRSHSLSVFAYDVAGTRTTSASVSITLVR